MARSDSAAASDSKIAHGEIQHSASDQKINNLMTLAYEQAMDKAAAKLACYREALERIAANTQESLSAATAADALEKARSLPDE